MKRFKLLFLTAGLLGLSSCALQTSDIYRDEVFLSAKYFLNDCRDIGGANPWDGHWLSNISDVSYIDRFSIDANFSFADFYVGVGEDGCAFGRGVISLADQNQTTVFYEEFSYYCTMNGNAAAYINILSPTNIKLSITNIYWLRVQIDYSFDGTGDNYIRLTFQFRTLRPNEHPQEFDS